MVYKRFAVLCLALALSSALGFAGPRPEGAATEPGTVAAEETATGDVLSVITPDKPMASYQEAPELAEMDLPPVSERLPDLPPIVQPHEQIGKYGGTMRRIEMYYTNFGSTTRFMREGLFAISAPTGEHLYPNLAESLDVSDGHL